MKCIFVRHGNTFETGQQPVWVGARTDLPLTETGRLQGHAVGRWCADHLHPKAIITSPLRRTRETAEIIQGYTSGELIRSNEMREIDYGLWEGLSSAEIESRYGASALKAWDTKAAWPSDAGWPQQEQTVTRDILDLMNGLERFGTGADVVLCTSNGILKTLSKHLIFAERPASLGVRTGHLCIVEKKGTTWCVLAWNHVPV
jgi:broad specificity phosphatase PhoE